MNALPPLFLIAVLLFIGFLLWPRGEEPQRPAQEEAPVQEAEEAPGELLIEDIEEGTGQEAAEGSSVRVHYTGTLEDGTVFDSSRERGEPLEFTIGEGQVIAGWEQGLLGMKEGGVRKLTVPPRLGYGDLEIGSIPPGSTLIFEVELLEVAD